MEVTLTRAAQVFRPGLVQVIGRTCSTPAGFGEHDGGVDCVVALAEDGGRDVELLVDDRLRRAGTVVDGRSDVEDGDAADRMLGGTGARGCSHTPHATGRGGHGTRGTSSRISDCKILTTS